MAIRSAMLARDGVSAEADGGPGADGLGRRRGRGRGGVIGARSIIEG